MPEDKAPVAMSLELLNLTGEGYCDAEAGICQVPEPRVLPPTDKAPGDRDRTAPPQHIANGTVHSPTAGK